jgi:hypothetical protein
MKTRMKLSTSTVSLALALATPFAFAGTPPVPSTWTITPGEQPGGVPGSVTFNANGAGTATQKGRGGIAVKWFAGRQGSFSWYLMDGSQPYQAFRYSVTQGVGFSCGVTKLQPSDDFKCTDSGYNFTMTRSSSK